MPITKQSVIARYEAISLTECITKFRDCFVPRNDAWSSAALFVLMLLTLSIKASAQTYNNTVYSPEIKSVEFYNSEKEASFPIITLGAGETVTLGFDDLKGGSRTLNYTLEHCDANWNSSRLAPAEYLQSFTDDRIFDYTYSTATFQKYSHYEIKLPNNTVAPKLPGNYILKVYEDGDPTKLLITRRLYVLRKRVSVAANVLTSNNVALRRTNQKVNFTIDYTGLNVQNPNQNIRTLIMQNARPETGRMNNTPTYIRGTQLVFNHVSINDFAGGNEFRHFDTRSLRLNSDRVARIYRDTANTVMLLGDPVRNSPNYLLLYDNDGKFFIINQTGSDARVDADYAHVYFTLAANRPGNEGTPYIIGQFNDYKIDENSRLQYDTRGRYYTNLFLKQGVYDYQYVWVSNATQKPDYTILEGSYFETENDYQLLVYYRPPGARWEELVGYALLNTAKQ